MEGQIGNQLTAGYSGPSSSTQPRFAPHEDCRKQSRLSFIGRVGSLRNTHLRMALAT
jgi:hypothetical protein